MQMQMVMVSKKIASWGGELVDNMNINFYNSSIIIIMLMKSDSKLRSLYMVEYWVCRMHCVVWGRDVGVRPEGGSCTTSAMGASRTGDA